EQRTDRDERTRQDRPLHDASSLASNFARNAHPASPAPTSGATINSQSWLSASPSTHTAGPSDRAGFTETPVTWMPTMWITTNVKPIANPANCDGAPFCVTPRMVTKNKNVATTSNTAPASRLYSPGEPVP